MMLQGCLLLLCCLHATSRASRVRGGSEYSVPRHDRLWYFENKLKEMISKGVQEGVKDLATKTNVDEIVKVSYVCECRS
jgi:hypothetical protein